MSVLSFIYKVSQVCRQGSGCRTGLCQCHSGQSAESIVVCHCSEARGAKVQRPKIGAFRQVGGVELRGGGGLPQVPVPVVQEPGGDPRRPQDQPQVLQLLLHAQRRDGHAGECICACACSHKDTQCEARAGRQWARWPGAQGWGRIFWGDS